jgi:hypothetical protein
VLVLASGDPFAGTGAWTACAIDDAALDHDRSTAAASQGARFLGFYLVSRKNPFFPAFTDISHGMVHGHLDSHQSLVSS